MVVLELQHTLKEAIIRINFFFVFLLLNLIFFVAVAILWLFSVRDLEDKNFEVGSVLLYFQLFLKIILLSSNPRRKLSVRV